MSPDKCNLSNIVGFHLAYKINYILLGGLVIPAPKNRGNIIMESKRIIEITKRRQEAFESMLDSVDTLPVKNARELIIAAFRIEVIEAIIETDMEKSK